MRELAGQGYELAVLLRAARLARSSYYYCLSHPEHVTRQDLEPLIVQIWQRTPNGCGHRQIHMCLVHEFGCHVAAKTVLKVMRRLGLRCTIRQRNPWKHYNSYRGDQGQHVSNILSRDFHADVPYKKLGTDVTEFKLAHMKAYFAPIYDMGSKEIIAWDIAPRADFAQQTRLLDMLATNLPLHTTPILHSDMGWQYQHPQWRARLHELGIQQSMSRKGNCLDNAATEQIFGHIKDEFYKNRSFETFEQFKTELTAYIIHWNTKRRQQQLNGLTPEEYRTKTHPT